MRFRFPVRYPADRQALVVATAIWAAVAGGAGRPAAAQSMIQLQQNGQTLVGLQLARTPSALVMLGTDGQIHRLSSGISDDAVRELDSTFTPDSAVAVRSRLRREFGPAMEVVATKHFLVVQPKGRGDHWPETFEQLHRQFTSQMRRRGVNVKTGRFPMVAVVMPDRPAMLAELSRQNISVPSVAGVYIPSSNRVYTFDGGWNEAAAATIRHEAAHQSAFNSNVHSRLNETPKWISEGLGMMFEPATMGAGSGGARIDDKVNPEARRQLRLRYDSGLRSLAGDIRRLVADDAMFGGGEVHDAYAVSWLMMFFLADRRPEAFAAILNHTASRPAFEPYSRDQRIADFESIVGRSLDQAAVEINAFLRSLP